jgi:hypothetical protein
MSQVPLLQGFSAIEDENTKNVLQILIDYLNQQDSGIQTVSSFKNRGTQTNDNAQPGVVGEYISSFISSPVNFPTSNQFGDLTNIVLTPGDWDISLFLEFNKNGATITGNTVGGIGTASGNNATGLNEGDNYGSIGISTLADNSSMCIPAWRVSILGTTTYYFKYGSNYIGGPPKAVGRISARRVR